MIDQIRNELKAERDAILGHPVFASIDTPAALARFMEHHVFAVWDFMTLLKSLQAQLTCTRTPWVPQGDPSVRRLINEIVLGEESDEHPSGGYSSHFELYLDAMEQCGADTAPVRQFVAAIASGQSAESAFEAAGVPAGARLFVRWTLEAASRSAHEIAAAFTFGREDLIPDLFREVVRAAAERNRERTALFCHYLERHIALDGATHSPLAFRMLEALCGNDGSKWADVSRTAREALIKRRGLLDEIEKSLRLSLSSL